MIPKQLREELLDHVASAVTPREAAVEVMRALQAFYGWLTDEAVDEAAEILSLSPLQVEELATFYEMISRRPVGKRVIHLCDSISCWSAGAESMMAYLRKSLGIDEGGTTENGIFTLVPCACLGNCGEGPTMLIGETLYGSLTPERLDQILEEEREGVRCLDN